MNWPEAFTVAGVTVCITWFFTYVFSLIGRD
jgi:hypothetical protein